MNQVMLTKMTAAEAAAFAKKPQLQIKPGCRPWIVYHPAGSEDLAEKLLSGLESGALSEDIVEERMLALNESPSPNSWAFGRMDSPDWTHVITRGHVGTLHIDELKIGEGTFYAVVPRAGRNPHLPNPAE